MYWGAAKWVPKLRVFKTDANPLLLRMKMDPAGHGWRFRDGTISSKIAHSNWPRCLPSGNYQ